MLLVILMSFFFSKTLTKVFLGWTWVKMDWYFNIIVQSSKLVGLNGSSLVDGPVSIDNILVLISADRECKCKFKVSLTFLVELFGEFLFVLPFMPVANELDFIYSGAMGRIPDKVDEIGRTWAWMIIAASGAQFYIHKKL